MIIGDDNNQISSVKAMVLNQICCVQYKSLNSGAYVEVVGYENRKFIYRIDDSLNVYETCTTNLLLLPFNMEEFTWSQCAINNSCYDCGEEEKFAHNLYESTYGLSMRIIKVPRKAKQQLCVSIGDSIVNLPLSAIFSDKKSAEHALLMSKLPRLAVAS